MIWQLEEGSPMLYTEIEKDVETGGRETDFVPMVTVVVDWVVSMLLHKAKFVI
jgi:hypothetical protein